MTNCTACGMSLTTGNPKNADNKEDNHVGGRNNHPLTMPMCKECHALFSRWQTTRRIPLGDDPDRGEAVKLASLLIGMLHTGLLASQRSGDAESVTMLRMLEHALMPAHEQLGIPLPNAVKPSPIASCALRQDGVNLPALVDMARAVSVAVFGDEHPLTRLTVTLADNVASWEAWSASSDARVIAADLARVRETQMRAVETALSEGGQLDGMACAFASFMRILNVIAETLRENS